MKKIIVAIFAISFLQPCFSQESNDDIFDDGLTDSHIGIGTDMVTNLGGTLNIYANVMPIPSIILQAGIGFLPFGKQTDFMNLTSHNLPIVTDSLTGGFYYSLSPRLIVESPWVNFNYFFYADYKHWKFTAQEIYNVKKLKGIVGMGYLYKLGYGFSVDATIGIYLARENVTANEMFTVPQYGSQEYHNLEFDEIGDNRSNMFGGFDFGIGINYNFGI